MFIIFHYVDNNGLVMGAVSTGPKEHGATVVIHVGPPKTASKTVQKELCDRTSLLARDGWTFLRPRQFGSMVKGSRGKIQVANVAACYTGYVFPYVINQTQTCLDWLEYIDKLRGTSHKVVMSSENFAQGQTPLLAQLASDLRHVTTKVIVVYRPFYDWIASVYRQRYAGGGSKPGFALWLTDSRMKEYAANASSTSVYSRYAAYFIDVVMRNLDSSLMANIACDDLGASRTCALFRESKMASLNVRATDMSAGECLSPAQLQTLENISIEMHRAAFGIVAPFPAADFHDKISSCFGNR